ncbi:MAG: 2-oxoacid:acceptor oxidoreductase family protein [Elusimicrobiota bacterium]|jgi:2-oxoglutarate ferredoxin oxidoreductase subunit gamma|nr:2-oxoacid:acceptor oxidoreductase family protein [Elusimicrobiota bacterium]
MKNEIVISGFGGQGTLLAGVEIAQAALEQGLQTTWFPSYGAEMRGGTANSTVVVSDDEIGSPVVFSPNALIALNELSLEKFSPRLVKGAVVIAPFKNKPAGDFNYFYVDVLDLAKQAGSLKAANMAAVGALICALEKPDTVSITLDSLLLACKKTFEKKPEFIGLNQKAIEAGYNFIKSQK